MLQSNLHANVEVLDDTAIHIPYTFQSAVRDLKAGHDASRITWMLLGGLTQDECLSLLDGDLPFWDGLRTILCDRYNRTPFIFGAVPRLGVPGIRFTDGPRGVVMGASTAFPVAMARGATWDPALEQKVGEAIGVEARVQGANLFAGICVNLPRHPAWGRIQETYGEDPLLLGRFGIALADGVRPHVMACVKHFAANSMENARFKVDVQMDEDVLHEVYLRHFQSIIDSGVEAVMSSYNSVNGEWAGQSGLLLNKVLRETWGFKGFVMTDFIFGLRDPILSLENGLDIEAPFMQQRHEIFRKALDARSLQRPTVLRSCARILRQQIQHYADRADLSSGLNAVYSDEHRSLARTVAARSMVLLTNLQIDDSSFLPLQTTDSSRVAIIGRLANTPNTGDKGSSAVFSPHVITPYEGMKAALPHCQVWLENADDVGSASATAARADTVICVVGYDHADEGEYVVPSLQNNPELLDLLPPVRTESDRECYKVLTGQTSESAADTKGSALQVGAGGDRRSLRLRQRDLEIINAVTAVNDRVVVVVVAAGAVIMEEWRHKPAAILMGWYSGCEGGHALADVLLGKVDASGRLPFSIPTDESLLPVFDIDATRIQYDRWHGQHLLDKLGVPAAFSFGFGLSYTTFCLSHPVVRRAAHGVVDISVRVRNTGSRSGRCHVQIYGYPRMLDFPARVLLGFAFVDLDADTKSAVLTIEASTKPLQRWRDGRFHDFKGSLPMGVARYSGDEEALKIQYQL